MRASRRSTALLGTIAAGVLCVVMGMLVFVEPGVARSTPGRFVVALEIAATRSGTAQLFFDCGDGFSEALSQAHLVQEAPEPQTYRFSLPEGVVRRIRIDGLNGSDAPVRIGAPRILRAEDSVVVDEISFDRLKPNDQVARADVSGDSLHIIPVAGSNDPYLTVDLDPPIDTRPTPLATLMRHIGVVGLVLLALVCSGWLWDRFHRATPVRGRLGERLTQWHRDHPRTALALFAAVGTTLCCYPTLFFGKSLFSPNYGSFLLYPGVPAVPGMHDLTTEDSNGADTGAMLWQHLPYSIIQHRALADDGEMPFWNRYNSCGATLLGQGQSMFGDPFHLPVIASGGAVWAWEAKFLLARFLFAAGLGWAVFAATRHFGAAALIGLTAPFIGFFIYRLNHPAYVSLCYSPWILAAWLHLGQAEAQDKTRRWFALLVFANWCELTSGTMKEAVVLAVSLNLVGFFAVLASPLALRNKRSLAGHAVLLAVAGLALTTPWWMTFADTLAQSWTAYDDPYALRIPTYRWLGLFDPILAAEYTTDHLVYAPAANILILGGLLLVAVQAPRLWRNATVWVCTAGLVVTLSIALEMPWLPTRWILAVPGLRSIAHVGNTFSCVAIILFAVLAGFGFASWSTEPSRMRRWMQVAVCVAALVAAILAFLHFAVREWENASTHRTLHSLLQAHRYFFLTMGLLPVGLICVAIAGDIRLRRQRWSGAALLVALSGLVVLLGRLGQHLTTGYDEYFQNPAPRAELQASSPAVEWLKQHREEPARAVGVDQRVFEGFTGVHDLEGITGPDALVNRGYRELADAAGISVPHDWYFPTDWQHLSTKQRIMDALNVRYYFGMAHAPEPFPWVRTVHHADLAVLESPTAWPRAFFVNTWRTYTSASHWVEQLESGDGRPFAAMLASDLPAGSQPPRDEAPVLVPATDYRLTSNSTTFTIRAPGPGLAVLHETWLPEGFQATVNGRPRAYLRVNHAFKAVHLESAGDYVISFRYQPPRWWLSLGLWLAGLAATLAIIAASGRSSALCDLEVNTQRPES